MPVLARGPVRAHSPFSAPSGGGHQPGVKLVYRLRVQRSSGADCGRHDTAHLAEAGRRRGPPAAAPYNPPSTGGEGLCAEDGRLRGGVGVSSAGRVMCWV